MKILSSISLACFGISSLIVASGYSIDRFNSSYLSRVASQMQAEAIAEESKILQSSKELEEIVIKLKERNNAYADLKQIYPNLIKHNQPAKMLESNIQKIDRVNTEVELSQLELELEKISDRAIERIEHLSISNQ